MKYDDMNNVVVLKTLGILTTLKELLKLTMFLIDFVFLTIISDWDCFCSFFFFFVAKKKFNLLMDFHSLETRLRYISCQLHGLVCLKNL